MKAIPTVVPGLSICDHLPRMAAVMDKVTVVRSVTHPYPLHCVAYTTSGIPEYDVSLETRPRDPRHWPYIGSVVDYVDRHRAAGAVPDLPQNIGLPWLLNSKSDIVPLAGPYAAFLGQAHDPFWPVYSGKGTKVGPKLSDAQTKEVVDPYAGLTADGRFLVSETARLPESLTLDRLDRRDHRVGAVGAVAQDHPQPAELPLDRAHVAAEGDPRPGGGEHRSRSVAV
jgi:hypothetical protein